MFYTQYDVTPTAFLQRLPTYLQISDQELQVHRDHTGFPSFSEVALQRK
jgi:DICT domain-containing protein